MLWTLAGNLFGAKCSRVVTAYSTVKTEGNVRIHPGLITFKEWYYRSELTMLTKLQPNSSTVKVTVHGCSKAYILVLLTRGIVSFISKGDIELGTCKEVVVAWWGSECPPGATF